MTPIVGARSGSSPPTRTWRPSASAFIQCGIWFALAVFLVSHCPNPCLWGAAPPCDREDAAAAHQETAADLYGDPLPAGATVRLGTARLRHGEEVWDIAFSPGGESVISVSSDSMKFWAVQSGELRQTIEMPPEWVTAFRVAADGKTAASIGWHLEEKARVIRLWDLESKTEISAISQPSSPRFSAVALTPDGNAVVTGDASGTLEIWDRAGGLRLLSYQIGQRLISTVDVSHDGQWLAIAS